MRFLLGSLIAAVCFGQPATTTITDTLFNSILGTPYNGSAIVQGPNVTAPGSAPILGGSRTVQIVDGHFSVAVVPNQTASPGSTYTITFDNGAVKTCNVPYSASPITLAAAGCVAGGSQPAQPGVIALSQLADGGAIAGQALCFGGPFWVPGNCGTYTVTADPSGACTAGTALRYNRANGNLWGCKNSVWTLAGGGGSGNATSVNGAAVPVNSNVLSTNGLGQLVDYNPINTSSLNTGISQPGQYAVTTDGSALSAGGGCAVFSDGSVSPLGVLQSGAFNGTPCLLGISSTAWRIFGGQTFASTGTGTVEGNRIRAYSSSFPGCASSADYGRAFLDTSTTTSHLKVCAAVSGTPTLITIF